jgi:hypothetical protein
MPPSFVLFAIHPWHRFAWPRLNSLNCFVDGMADRTFCIDLPFFQPRLPALDDIFNDYRNGGLFFFAPPIELPPFTVDDFPACPAILRPAVFIVIFNPAPLAFVDSRH